MKNKIRFNYHTHTPLCGHAFGSPEDYVIFAIEQGYKVLGFSDHAPFKGFKQPGIRMDFSELDLYIRTISNLREKYKDQIKIYIGLEIEYSKNQLNYYKELFTKYHLDYLILGNHCYLKNNKLVFYSKDRNNPENVKAYVDSVIEAMKSGYFLYLAHPDFIMNSYDDKKDPFLLSEIERLIKAAELYHCPLEINLQGSKHKFYSLISEEEGEYNSPYYPYLELWEIVSRYNIETVVGVDIHNSYEFQHNHQAFAYYLINKYKLNYIEDLDDRLEKIREEKTYEK